MLFFFAGYEIDFERIKGQPLRLAAFGWLISLVLAYSIGGLLSLAGIVLSLVFTGSALATTAIGTLIPILRDAGELKTRFGTYLLGAGAMGEFGPILLITLVFSTKGAVENAVILIAFVVAGGARRRDRGALDGPQLEPVRAHAGDEQPAGDPRHGRDRLRARGARHRRSASTCCSAASSPASSCGSRCRGREVEVLESKLTAVGYGFLIPFFFVASGVAVDLGALLDDPVQFLKVPLFLALFLLVRGAPALLLYRKVLDARERAALALFSATELPLVVAITTIAVEEGHMRSSTAASLILAAICSTAIYPILGLRLRGDSALAAEGA